MRHYQMMAASAIKVSFYEENSPTLGSLKQLFTIFYFVEVVMLPLSS